MSLFTLIGAITLVGVCYFRLRAAGSLADAAPWARLADQTGWGFPVSVVGLLVTGGYMTSHGWTWSTGWIDVSIAALVLVTLQGPLVAGPRTSALKRALEENGPGPLGDSARRLTRDRALWVVLFANPGIVLGITWNMTAKPGTGGAIAAVVIGCVVGIAAALAATSSQASGGP